MHDASHAVLIGEYTHARDLTPFASGSNVTVNGSIRVGRSPRRPRQKAFQCRSKIYRSLTLASANKPIATAVSTALAKVTATLALLLLWLHTHVRSAREKPLDGLIRRPRGTWTALLQGLHHDAYPRIFFEVRLFHTLHGEVTLARAFAKAVIDVDSQNRESRAPQDHHVLFARPDSVRDRIHHHRSPDCV